VHHIMVGWGIHCGNACGALLANCNYDMGGGESFADDLNEERGTVSGRVALLLRSTEVKPLF
jgi:hypothetical protein